MRAISSGLLGIAALTVVAHAAVASPDDPQKSVATRDPEAAARRYLIGELLVTRPLIRTVGAQDGSTLAFVDIENRGKAADRLLSVSIEGADQATIAADKDPAPGSAASLAIAPGDAVKMNPDGPHLLLQGLKQPLKDGETVEGLLEFERAGPLPIEFTVGSDATP